MLSIPEATDKRIKQATEIAAKIADHFKVQHPIIKHTNNKSERAFCHYGMRGAPCCIRFSFNLWTDVETAIIHEMAHVVSWETAREHGHGEFFQKTLRNIAQFYYGDASKYRWDLEYNNVAASAGVQINSHNRRRESVIVGFMKMGMTRQEAEKLTDS
jgi:hypothetical protein